MLLGPHCVKEAAFVRLREVMKSARTERRLGILSMLADVGAKVDVAQSLVKRNGVVFAR